MRLNTTFVFDLLIIFRIPMIYYHIFPLLVFLQLVVIEKAEIQTAGLISSLTIIFSFPIVIILTIEGPENEFGLPSASTECVHNKMQGANVS